MTRALNQLAFLNVTGTVAAHIVILVHWPIAEVLNSGLSWAT